MKGAFDMKPGDKVVMNNKYYVSAENKRWSYLIVGIMIYMI